MRSILLPLVVLCGLTAPAFAQVPIAYRATRTAKHEGFGLPLVPSAPGITGEDFLTPIVIGSLPYSDSRSSCGFLNNVQGTCGGAGPDVVYAFTPSQTMCATISLCDPSTAFDTVLDLYENSTANLVSCSDDACSIRSEIPTATLTAGNTYYIVVDGFGGACGDYTLKITPCSSACTISSPPGVTAEGEPMCANGWLDTYNAGCNSTPPSWTDVPCSQTPVTLMGHYGDYITNGVVYRDTDWYRIVAGQPTTLYATLNSEVDADIAIVDISGGCGNVVEKAALQSISACMPYLCSATVPAGTYFVFVAPSDFVGASCSARYTLTVSGGSCSTATRPRSWGSLKALYR